MLSLPEREIAPVVDVYDVPVNVEQYITVVSEENGRLGFILGCQMGDIDTDL